MSMSASVSWDVPSLSIIDRSVCVCFTVCVVVSACLVHQFVDMTIPLFRVSSPFKNSFCIIQNVKLSVNIIYFSLPLSKRVSNAFMCYLFSICLSICMSVYLSVCLSICLSVYLSIRMSVCLSICLSVCLSIRPCTCLPVCPLVWLSGCQCHFAFTIGSTSL